MASRINYGVTMTPIVTMTSADAADKDVIGSDIGKSLGGKVDVAIGQEAHTTVGYAAGVVAYLDAATGVKTKIGGDATPYDMVFIKNVGNVYLSPTTLDVASTILLDVFIEYTDGAAYVTIASIPAGGAIALPNFPAQPSLMAIWVQPASGSVNLAVEYALVQ